MSVQSNQSEGIRVGIRMRPLNEREKGGIKAYQCQADRSAIRDLQGEETYTYDKVFDEASTTADVYSSIAKEIVTGVMNGINGTVFAYGQTSSGKTHTMLGSGDQLGVLGMAALDIFETIEANPQREYLIRASFVEIYNESIRDLLSDSDGYVQLREHAIKGAYIEGAVESMVTSVGSLMKLQKSGTEKRTVEATAMNEHSSRSHSIFKLVIESRGEDGAVLVGTLNLVDLAGSESAKHTGATGQRAKEGGKINQSLLSLRLVIKALTTPNAIPPYRDSKLTHLLKPSLSGNAKMSIICCITPAAEHQSETKSTLLFAGFAKNVKTHATVNLVEDDSVVIRRLTREIEELRAATSEDAINRMRELEQRATELAEEVAQKNTVIDQLKARCEGSDESKDDTFAGSERRSSKRPRTEESAGEAEETVEAAPTLASIKNALSMMHQRRAMTAAPPAMVLAAVESAAAAPVAAAPVVPVQTAPKQEEQKVVPFNPMAMGLRNQLMKELDFKLVKRKNQVDAAETTAPAPDATDVSAAPAVDSATSAQEIAQLQEELARAKATIADQECTIDMVSAARDEASQSLEVLEACVAEQSDEHARKMAAADELVASLQAQLSEAAAQNAAAQQQQAASMDAVQAENSQLQDEVASLLSQLEDLQGTFTKETTGLQKEVAQLKESLEAAETETLSLLEQLEQVQVQGSDSAEHLQQMKEKDEQLAQTSEALSASQIEVARVQEELQASLAALSELQTVHAASLETLAELTASCETQRSTIAELESANAAQTETIASLQAEVESAAELQAAFEGQQSTVADLQAECAAQTETIASLQSQVGAVADLQASIEGQQSIIAELESAKAAHLATIASLEADAESAAGLMTSCEGHQTAIADLETLTAAQSETIASLEAGRAADAESVAAMEAKMHEIIEQGLLAEEHLEAARDSVTELQGLLAVAEDKLSDANTELAAAHSASAELECNLRHAQELYAASQQELAVFQARAAELEASLQQATETAAASAAEETISPEQMQQLQAELKAEQAKSAAFAEELSAIQANASDQAAAVEALTADLAAATDRAVDLEAQKAALEEKVEALESELAENATNSKANGDIITELEASLVQSLNDQQAVEEDLATANASLDELRAEKEDLCEQLTSLQAQLAGAEEEVRAAKASLAATSASSGAGAGVARMNEFDMDQQTLDASRKDMERLVANVKAELGSKEAEVSRLMAALAEAQQRATTAEQRVVSSDNAFDQSDIEGTKKRAAQLQTTVDLLSGEKDSLVLRLQQAEKELKSREGAAAVAIEKLERDIAGLNRQIEKLSQEAAQVVVIQQNAAEIKHRLDDMAALRDQHQQRADAAVKHIEALELQIEQLSSSAGAQSHQDSTETRSQLLELQQDIAELSARLKKSQDATAQLREQWEQAEADRVAAVQQLTTAEADKAALVADLEAAMDNINSLTDALEEATNDAEIAAAAAAASSTAAPATIGIAMQPMEAEHEEALAALEEEVAQLRSEKEMATLEAEVARDELSHKIELLQEEVADITDRLQGSESTVQSLREEVGALQEAAKQDASEMQHLSGLTKHQAHQIAELMGQLEEVQRNGNQTEKLNLLMAQLQEAQASVARVEGLEEKVSYLQEELYAAEKQVEALTESSASETAGLRAEFELKLESLTEQLAQKDEELASVVAENEQLAASTEAVKQELSAQQAKNQSLARTISELEGDLEDLKEQSSGASAEALESLQSALSAAKSELQIARDDLRAANEHCAVNEDMVSNLQEQLQVKEQRIVHLDAHKLTKEQMDKIKVIKEERKKFQEDAKVLKKQLLQLTTKYEELRQSAKQAAENRANGVGGGPSTDYVISDLRVQLVTANEALTAAQGEVKRIKGKLLECANQLKVYENDHSGIVAVLERYGVDIRGLIPLDHSVDEDTSALHGDIADAVGQLGEKLDAAKAQLSRRETSKAEKTAELEERLAQQISETQEAVLQKANLEKRLEVLKASAKTARETSTAMTLEIETLTARVAELKDELSSAQKRVTSTSDVVSSEVQALEEENIELLKENKDLRIQVSRLKAGNPAPAASSAEGFAAVASPVPTRAPASLASGPLSGHKRAFGTDISNTAPTPSTAAKASAEVSKAGGPALSESQLEDGNKGKSRRTRVKAKAMVDDSVTASQDEAGECKQS